MNEYYFVADIFELNNILNIVFNELIISIFNNKQMQLQIISHISKTDWAL